MPEDIITNELDILKVVKHPKSRIIPDSLCTTQPDMTNEDETEPRLLLSCGHAIAIDTLYQCITVQLMDGKQEITCEECKEEWDFPDICNKAQMSMDEILFWGIKINLNNLSGVCPKCATYCENVSEQNELRMKCSRKGCSFEFCWNCKVTWTYNHECYSRKELRDILKNAQERHYNILKSKKSHLFAFAQIAMN
ncbi:unnamed protein product [Mytilus edulis]|uniref:RBR-type E3 ubiquitin transferase n=1 Tax=Mytilus edulis TaxID=6550 RepID=A0A8S3TNM9_MYTED|nr:unnamed protein product [Mytilus edulis]